MDSILVICVGNICRSPVAAALFKRNLPEWRVSSAGLRAVVGSGIDLAAAAVAWANGVVIDDHVAQQFSYDLGRQYDLILVQEKGHRQAIINEAPQLSGRVMQLGKWKGDMDIPDPYQKSHAFHAEVFERISESVVAWSDRLKSKRAE